MNKTLLIFAGLFFLVTYFAVPSPVFAHAFGQLYTLPLPVWLYLYGGGAAVVVSFVLIGYFVGQRENRRIYAAVDISNIPLVKFVVSDTSKFFFKVFSIFVFVLTIIAGYIGKNDPSENFNTVFVWIIFWLGLTYLIAIFGNLWMVLNPWKIIVELVEGLMGIVAKGIIKYPKTLGYLPALTFYFIFIWLELLSNGWGVRPTYLSTAIVVYTFLNFTGVVLFGKDIWFRYFEFFSVFFKLISKLSPIEIKTGQVFLRSPFIRLLSEEAENLSLLAFVLFMLSSTAFDGFRSTTTWRSLNLLSSFDYQISQSILLTLSPLFFLLFYFYSIVFIKIITKSNFSLWNLAQKFAFSLIPIAFAYNVAHYYTLLLIQGQSIIRTLSDPFGLGWNLFNTASFIPNIGLLGASFVWHSQVAVIIIGHIAAVYVAHILATGIFPSRKNAILGQIPMLILMIVYTMTGLWILSQPLTIGG